MSAINPDAARARIGEQLGVSDWVTIDQARIDAFADVTGDHQFIHVDPVRAAETPFGGTIAHGMLTLSLIGEMFPAEAIVLEGMTMGLNYGFDRVRFLAPVRSGRRVRARHYLVAIESRGPGNWLVTTRIEVEIEGEDKPALVADWLGLQICAAPQASKGKEER